VSKMTPPKVASIFQRPNEKSRIKSTSEKSTTVPWVEKYRPRKVDELVYQDEVVAVLTKCLSGADLPNLLFYGPPGTGKTSAASALCRQLFKTSEAYKDRVLEMNASDERGIDVVRHRIKDFARRAVATHMGTPLKVVILDEADAMTGPAQAALRRTMEKESHTTRFFLICNYITRIIEPLTSRCAKFRFKPLPHEAQRERLLLICGRENVSMEADAIEELVEISQGDLRKSITILQSMACLGKEISKKDVQEMSGYVPEEIINEIMASVQSGDFKAITRTMTRLRRLGYGANQMLLQLTEVFLHNDTLQEKEKAKIYKKMSECEVRLIDGASEHLQLYDLCAFMQKCFVETSD
jgi:replication factor C subunit 2/4